MKDSGTSITINSEQLQGDSHTLARQLVEELRQEIGKPVDKVPRTRSIRQAYWALGIFAALLVGGVELEMVLVRAPVVTVHPSAETLSSYEGDSCAQRQQTIMRAIGNYAHDHNGVPPRDLSVLGAPYLNGPPADPLSGQWYKYLRQGSGVSIACPNPELHKPVSQTPPR
jgi:hypothetical protein